MRRKWFVRAGALLLSAVMLTGCGGTKQNDADTDTAPQAAEDAQPDDGADKEAEGGQAGREAAGNLPVDDAGNPSPLGKYQEPVILKVAQTINATVPFPEGQSATDNDFFDFLKEHMNVEVEVMWQAASSEDYNEKLNLAISSGELPDIISVNGPQLKILVESGMIEDLTDYYEIYGGDIMKGAIDSTQGQALGAVTYDGRMMALPNVKALKDGYDLLWIRQDWLDKLGLEVPKTIDDIHSVAKAFVDNHMGGDNTVGFLSPTSGSQLYSTFLSSSGTMTGFGGFFQANRAFPGYWVEDGNGEITYGSLTKETKATLEILAAMYQDGTLDPELGMRKDADEAWKSGRAGMMFAPWWLGYSLEDALANDPQADWQAYPYPLTEDGKWSVHMMNPSDSFWVVKKGYEHPEIIFVMNNFYQELNSVIDTIEVDKGLQPSRTLLNAAKQKESDAQIINRYLETDVIPEYDKAEHSLMENDLNTIKGAKLEPYDDMSISFWNPEDANFGRLYSIMVGVGAIDAGYEIGAEEVYSELYWQTDGMQRKWSNLQKLEDEMFLKMILGTVSMDEFDQFVEDWKSQGGEDIIREVNEAVNG